MRHTRSVRQPFDPLCDFVYLRPTRVNGVAAAAGDPVVKAALTARRLRQMYDVRMIAYAAGQSPRKPPPRPRAVGPTDLLHPGEAHPPEQVGRRRVVARRAA